MFSTSTDETLVPIIDPMNFTCAKYMINTPQRVAAFLAQTGHESAGFKARIENLNYSDKGLCLTWPKRFRMPLGGERVDTLRFADGKLNAKMFARQPEMIANYVYGGRMGNGPPESGDGWTYRGAGFIQLTGKELHMRFAQDQQMSLEEVTQFLHTVEGACESAGWYWHMNNLNVIADAEDMVELTRRINGGQNGLTERVEHYHAAMEWFSQNPVDPAA
jgi:putative chitinase